jgi:hypothetical protein
MIAMVELVAASGTARAAAPAGRPSPRLIAPLPADPGRFGPLADLAGAAPADDGLSLRWRGGLRPGHAAAGRAAGFGVDDPVAGLRPRLRAPAPGFALVVAPHLLPPAAVPRPGSRRARLLLPVWAQMAFGRWSVLGGGDYVINPGAGHRDAWRSGFALLRSVSPRLSLGAEFSHESADMIDSHASTGLGLGARWRLAGPFSLMLSGGPSFEHHGGAGVRAYTALNIAF